jgi:hypothetical protein
MASTAVTHDRVTVRLAELDSIRDVLSAAADRLSTGWTQGRWRSSEGMCLVGAIRLQARGQLSARALDVVWHARHDDLVDVGWVPPPEVRLARVRDLTHWNDAPDRTAEDVLALLEAADRCAAAEMARLRARLGLAVRARRARQTTRPEAGWPASPSARGPGAPACG